MKRLLLLLLLSSSCTGPCIKSSTPVPNMMDALIAEGSMGEFKNVQGGGHTVQGHSIYLRFEASPEIIQKYFNDKSVYRDEECKVVMSRLEDDRIKDLPKHTVGFIEFQPPWKPQTNTSTRCLRGEPKGQWGGTNFVLIDSASGLVYLYSIGT